MTLYIAITTTLTALGTIALLIHQIITTRRFMEDIGTILKKIDDATTAAGQRVDALIASIKSNGATLTAEQQAEADAIVAHLTAIGSDPTNPAPAPADTTTT